MELKTEDSKLIQPAGKIIDPAGKESRTAPPRSGFPNPSAPREAGNTGPLLGADGRELPKPPASAAARFSAPLVGFAERNPRGAALLSLGVGLVAGAILGVVIKRD